MKTHDYDIIDSNSLKWAKSSFRKTAGFWINLIPGAREQMESHLVINYKKFQEYSHLLEFPFPRE